MPSIELAKAYNPKDFEDRIYAFWRDGGYFKPNRPEADPFVVVIPPPNVTGVLHMGHGLNNCLQDVLVRYHRMLGKNTLWVPGTDHAGIATQNVVERRLLSEGIAKEEIGREAFVEKTWEVKRDHHAHIVRQLERIGASCDWDRERFTMDEGLSRAVREVFVSLYERGLVYRGRYLVNWCHSCGTALSDDEVDHQEVQGAMYHIAYPLTDGSGSLEIATTRPETLLGDTGVAVHPDDERYRHLIGKTLKLPLTDREIPIVADSYVDREFGTGAVKVTPAHDPNDREMGMRHQLEAINILRPDGRLNEAVPPAYRGMTVEEGRKAVVEDLKKGGFFIREQEHSHQVGHCYRCNTAVEPYLSDQWFVRMKPLADKALQAWKDGKLRFYPKRWENTYVRWLEGIRDWCVSRQLWWGHRIPVWYCDDCNHMMVEREDPSVCSSCGSSNIRQDEDVLDTWFSSWLWPFSTLGWPDKTEDLAAYYPTTALVTAYDIIFFWVARMIMAGIEFMGEVPFRDIYIHQLVRDKQGRKMSKSLGNGIDPIQVVEEYGADALKFTLAFLAAQGQDILLDENTFKIGSKFANKVWNAARFILMNLEEGSLVKVPPQEYSDIDRWIYHRLNKTSAGVEEAMASFRFNDAAHEVYEFFWNDYCDWYLEAAKPSLYGGDNAEKQRILSLLVALLEESLRLLHPFLPFLTEELYQKLPAEKSRGALINADYPRPLKQREDLQVEKEFASLMELVRLVRTARSEFTIPPSQRFRVSIFTENDYAYASFLQKHRSIIEVLMGAEVAAIGPEVSRSADTITAVGEGFHAYLHIRELIDLPKERSRMEKEVTRLEGLLEKTEKKLSGKKFLENAPEEVVEKEQAKREEFSRKIASIKGYLEQLTGDLQ
ncbi:MAG: valine--tRNA ligase [Spirochaetales bacterium]|nr:valine--tRNA ligase [Spirochaetales bacterium]MCF7937187.1 valine--tRNA ligase [Spirochaetales bacterium]